MLSVLDLKGLWSLPRRLSLLAALRELSRLLLFSHDEEFGDILHLEITRQIKQLFHYCIGQCEVLNPLFI